MSSLGIRMKHSINNFHPKTQTEKGLPVTTNADIETAVARLKEHLSNWGAPFANMEDRVVREVGEVLRDHWSRRAEGEIAGGSAKDRA